MYFSQLRPDQQETLLAVLAGVMVADRQIRPEEELHLHNRQVANKLPTRTYQDLLAIPTAPETLRAVFDTPAIRVVAVLEIVEMAYSDGVFHPAEQDVLVEFTKALGLPRDELKTLVDLVERRVAAEHARKAREG